MTKAELRKQNLAIRKSISLSDKELFDKLLTEKIISLSEFALAESVLLFASIDSEVNTEILFDECIKQNKKIYFPKCIDGEKMEFFRAVSKNDLVTGKYGIPEPDTKDKYRNCGEGDIAVIPALAVGKDFTRLGYGKGYYDRFLTKFSGTAICPIYSQLVCDTVPTDSYDVPVEIIITPEETIRRR